MRLKFINGGPLTYPPQFTHEFIFQTHTISKYTPSFHFVIFILWYCDFTHRWSNFSFEISEVTTKNKVAIQNWFETSLSRCKLNRKKIHRFIACHLQKKKKFISCHLQRRKNPMIKVPNQFCIYHLYFASWFIASEMWFQRLYRLILYLWRMNTFTEGIHPLPLPSFPSLPVPFSSPLFLSSFSHKFPHKFIFGGSLAIFIVCHRTNKHLSSFNIICKYFSSQIRLKISKSEFSKNGIFYLSPTPS